MGTLRPLARSVGDRTLQSLCDGFILNYPEVDPSELAVTREFAFSSNTADEFAFFYQASEMVSKFQDTAPEGASSRRTKAFEAFQGFEVQCADANHRLVDLWSRARVNTSVFARARAIIGSVLGAFPWESFPGMCGFGPGASSGLKRRDSSHQNKWVLSSHITERALPYYAAFRRWADLDLLPDRLIVVAGNKVTTVPKNWKTDRLIAIEPDWNAFLQHGVGSLIRQRLQRVGLLLPDAQDTNRALARLGAWTGSLATLDLKGASDCVSLALCEALLPEDWLKVLLDLRSPEGVIEGQPVTYEKISSMGNGFTFELETLMFYALVRAAAGKVDVRRISVYGDDIICPTESAASVITTLEEAGFSVNVEKSFFEGPFRESCGGHYWRGKDVTPFYVRNQIKTIGNAIVLANQLQGWAERFPKAMPRVRGAFRLLRAEIPKALRGPWGADGTLWSAWDESCPRWHNGYQSYRQLMVVRKNRYTDLHESDGAYLHKLWNESTDLQASVHTTSSTVERTTRRFFCRDAWSIPPVRLA